MMNNSSSKTNSPIDSGDRVACSEFLAGQLCHRSAMNDSNRGNPLTASGSIIRAFAILALALATSSVAAAPLSNPTGPDAMAPELAETGSGAVLTWIERFDNGHALRFATFDGERFGEAGEIAHGTGWFANWADTPRLFVTPGGDWVAHWPVKSGESTYAYDVVVSRSTDQGESWSLPAIPHRDETQTEHGFVSYFADREGTPHLVWLDGRHTAIDADEPAAREGHVAGNVAGHGSGAAMTLRTASMVGAAFGPSVELDDRVCDCCQTASALTGNGPVVVYRDRSDDEVRDIHIVRRVDGEWTSPAPVAEDGWVIGGCPVNGPDVAADGVQVAAAWFTMANHIPAVRLALSEDAGETFPVTRRFSEGSALGRVQLARHDDDWLLLWMDEVDGGASLKLARIGRDGETRSVRVLADLGPGRGSGFPRMAVVETPRGDRLLVAWTGSDQHPSGERTTHVRTAAFDLGGGSEGGSDSPPAG
ncbi:glycoside hydrolase [Halomonas denitrificans]|nr:glycoside hydrolase [Halomonas denitrificans]